MRTPSFRYMGGKSRMRDFLISYFPKHGNIYLEPFVGLGNVFFHAKKYLDFEDWFLGDQNASFLSSLMKADLDQLPERVSREQFENYKKSNDPIAKIIEPRITFAGKGYKAGFDHGDKSHPPYNGLLYRPICEEAKRLLKDTTIVQCPWDSWDFSCLGHDSFIYLDPPYYGTKASYPNIDHEKLIKTLNKTKCKWAISGYDSELYNSTLKFKDKCEKQRNSEIKGSNTRKYEPVKEVLWTNY